MELHDPSKQLTSVVNLIDLRHLTNRLRETERCAALSEGVVPPSILVISENVEGCPRSALLSVKHTRERRSHRAAAGEYRPHSVRRGRTAAGGQSGVRGSVAAGRSDDRVGAALRPVDRRIRRVLAVAHVARGTQPGGKRKAEGRDRAQETRIGTRSPVAASHRNGAIPAAAARCENRVGRPWHAPTDGDAMITRILLSALIFAAAIPADTFRMRDG